MRHLLMRAYVMEYYFAENDQSAHIPFEAWVNLEAGIFLNLQTGKRSMMNSGGVSHRILIKGRGSINRSLHGDIVVVRLLPKGLWSIAESNHKITNSAEPANRNNRLLATSILQPVPSGRVVYVVKPSYRQFVATLQLDTQDIESLGLEAMQSGTLLQQKAAMSLSSSREQFYALPYQ